MTTTNSGWSPLAKGETLTKGKTAMISKQTAKFISSITNNLPADLDDAVMQGWIENPKGLQKFLRGLCPPKFPVWKTIKLGTGLKTLKDFGKALEKSRCCTSDWGYDIIGKPAFAFTVSDTETEVGLVHVSAQELGFEDGATLRDIFKRALEFDLELCPAEVGPQLRLQYSDQPQNECLRIAMEPITTSRRHQSMLMLGHDRGNNTLTGFDSGHPDHFWRDSSFRWVFLRSK